MIRKIGYLILTVILMLASISTFCTPKVYAQGSTKIVVATDKTYYNVGDTVKVTVQAQDVVDLFGLQFTIHYDPSMLSMEEDNFTFSDGYTVFGGSTVDKDKGIVTYPVINKNPSTNKQDSVTVGYANFKAVKEGPVTLNMDNIKSVNSESAETNYNTQTQAVFNIAKAPSNSSGGDNVTGNTNQGSSDSSVSNGSSNGNSGSSSSSISSSTGNGSSTSNSNGSSNSNAQGITASTSNSVNQTANANTASQSESGNNTNQNTSSNGTTNSAAGSTQNSSKDANKKETADSKSNSNLNIILIIVLVVVIVGCAVVAFLNRKKLKDMFFNITNGKN